MISAILFAVQSTVPYTGMGWSLAQPVIIIGACLLCLFIIPRVVWYPHVGPKMPLPFPSVFNNPSVATFLAAMAAGHLIGVGAYLGLTNVGYLAS
ncbi:photosystem I reaction center subunit PsaK [Chlorogloeopsis sp. ULAP01]|uniref:photosystem I reaction center subunit PsaK n=1 Tax=Chlorogloeopsis sp. ULAP01 TaxID=3056483 RepID=UPI0025AAF7FC|nr:photosystem I reaction center subunit PsaK [Chlorogloeopsis sp. ULAP01]MDM9384368.1 photosystem I reaction center subunit PsaK [Chlorogloeopsis sp. ULAP01]